MKYEVIHDFNDAQDSGYAYHEGDIFPRDGAIPSEVRIKDLIDGNNMYKIPLIKPYTGEKVVKEVVKEEKVEPKKDVVLTEETINKMPFMKLKSVAKQNGIDVEDKKAADIKAELIAKIEE